MSRPWAGALLTAGAAAQSPEQVLSSIQLNKGLLQVMARQASGLTSHPARCLCLQHQTADGASPGAQGLSISAAQAVWRDGTQRAAGLALRQLLRGQSCLHRPAGGPYWQVACSGLRTVCTAVLRLPSWLRAQAMALCPTQPEVLRGFPRNPQTCKRLRQVLHSRRCAALGRAGVSLEAAVCSYLYPTGIAPASRHGCAV